MPDHLFRSTASRFGPKARACRKRRPLQRRLCIPDAQEHCPLHLRPSRGSASWRTPERLGLSNIGDASLPTERQPCPSEWVVPNLQGRRWDPPPRQPSGGRMTCRWENCAVQTRDARSGGSASSVTKKIWQVLETCQIYSGLLLLWLIIAKPDKLIAPITASGPSHPPGWTAFRWRRPRR